MSKMDNLRAMREARYAEMTKRSAAQPGATGAAAAARKRPPVAPPVTPASDAVSVAPDAGSVDAGPALCGHRNMSGRTCTREQGHAAKSHRYS